jgi:hypothetical protein
LLNSLHKNEGGELEGPTLGKIKQVMMVILRHAEEYGHLPTGFATELGKQISISTSSDYEAVILTPEQTMTIRSYMSAGAYPYALDCRYWIALVGNRGTSMAGH